MRPKQRDSGVDNPQGNSSEAGDKRHEERLLSLAEASFQLGRVHRTTVMRWVKEGKLRCVRLSRKAIRFEPAELERFIREHRSIG